MTWEEADDYLRLDRDEEQKSLVERLIRSATAHLDGPDGVLGRALGLQTLEARFDELGCEPLWLPCPPFVDVQSIWLFGRDTAVEIDADAYVADQGYLVAGAAGWPALPSRWGVPRVRVRYRAGYAVDPNAEPVVPAVPEPIKEAILLMVAELFRNRELTAADAAKAGDRLLQPFEVYA